MADPQPTDLHGYKRIVLFGGSFDPPHVAHTLLPQQVAEQIGADLIVYVPAGRAPHKLDQQQTAPEHRLAMLRLALADAPGGVPRVVLTDEIDRGPYQPSYTVQTLEAIRERLDSDTELRLLIGADQLRIFDSWREPERVIALAQPVVMVRPPDTRASLLASLPESQRDAWSGRLVDVQPMDVSSTAVRTSCSSGEPINDKVCDAVADYIAEHRLYQQR